MGLAKKTCYTIECDIKDCGTLCNNLEAYVGALDGLTLHPEQAEYLAREHGFVQISARKWCCPDCAVRLGYTDKKV